MELSILLDNGYTRSEGYAVNKKHGSRFGYHGNYNGFLHNAISKSRIETFEAVSSIMAA
jgi:hypothetical protein